MDTTPTRSCTRALTALGLVTFFNVPLAAQDHGHAASPVAQYVEDFETMSSKFLELAGAMQADSYTWRPMDSVRTVSEVFMLIAAENYMIPSVWGAAPPAGITADRTIWRTLAAVTDKAQVMEHLEKSSAYYKEALAGVSADKLHETVNFFGEERTVNDAIFIITGDMHEHLGQAIAYARMNKVVPPWTARAR